jgi:hypothetical protein
MSSGTSRATANSWPRVLIEPSKAFVVPSRPEIGHGGPRKRSCARSLLAAVWHERVEGAAQPPGGKRGARRVRAARTVDAAAGVR